MAKGKEKGESMAEEKSEMAAMKKGKKANPFASKKVGFGKKGSMGKGAR